MRPNANLQKICQIPKRKSSKLLQANVTLFQSRFIRNFCLEEVAKLVELAEIRGGAAPGAVAAGGGGFAAPAAAERPLPALLAAGRAVGRRQGQLLTHVDHCQ